MYRIDLQDTNLRNLPRLLQLQSQHNADQDFLISEGERISFLQAEQQSDKLAAGLKSLGVNPVDKVALFLENGVEMVLLALAINKLRAIWVPINTDYKGEWLTDTIVRSRPTVLITQSS